jgi:hypothetical protein
MSGPTSLKRWFSTTQPLYERCSPNPPEGVLGLYTRA